MAYKYLHVPRPGHKRRHSECIGKFKDIKRGSADWGPMDYQADPDACKDLWSAVLLQAFYDVKNGNSSDIRGIILWLAGDDFVQVCTFAGMEPSKIANKLIDELSNYIIPKEWADDLLTAKLKYKHQSLIA